MRFTKSLHAEPGPSQMQQLLLSSDETPSPQASRRFHVLVAIVAVGALAASAGLSAVDDPRPLDVQLSSAMHRAGATLRDWQAQLSRGLQVSLRAVADGEEGRRQAAPAPQTATLVAAAAPAIDADNRDQPVQPEAAPAKP